MVLTARTRLAAQVLTMMLGLLLAGILVFRFALPRLVDNQTSTEAHQGMHTMPTITAPTKGTRLDPPKALPDWTLTSHTGAPFGLRELRGKPAMVFFGYTSCPDVCPTTLADFKQIQQALGPQAADVSFVLISVDGIRDTPAQLARYLKPFGDGFIGLTGDASAVTEVASGFGAYFQPVDAGATNYLVDHGAYMFLVDAEGQLQVVYSYGTPPTVIVDDLQQQLAQQSAGARRI